MTKVFWSIFTTILLAVVGYLLSGIGQPNLKASYEGADGELPVIFFMLQSHEEKPITIKRINVDGEYDIPLASQVVLKNGETFSQCYDWSQGPPINHVTVETDRGIYNQDIHGTWPAIANVFDIARKASGHSQPVLPPTPTPSPSAPTPTPAKTANSELFGTPQPTPTPSEPVNSASPIVISGSFINQVSGEQGDLILTVEHLIDTEDGKLAFGAKLKLGQYSTRSVCGSYDPSTAKISFGQGDRTDYRWTGSLSGEDVGGTFESPNANSQQHGLWQAKHLSGLTFEQASKAYGVTPSLPRIVAANTPEPVDSLGSPESSTMPPPVVQSTPIMPIVAGPASPVQNISNPSVDGEYVGQTLNGQSGITHQIKIFISGKRTGGTNFDIVLVTPKGPISGTGEMVNREKPYLTLHFAGVMTLEGSIEGGVFQGKWTAKNPDNNQVFSGTFQLKKTL